MARPARGPGRPGLLLPHADGAQVPGGAGRPRRPRGHHRRGLPGAATSRPRMTSRPCSSVSPGLTSAWRCRTWPRCSCSPRTATPERTSNLAADYTSQVHEPQPHLQQGGELLPAPARRRRRPARPRSCSSTRRSAGSRAPPRPPWRWRRVCAARTGRVLYLDARVRPDLCLAAARGAHGPDGDGARDAAPDARRLRERRARLHRLGLLLTTCRPCARASRRSAWSPPSTRGSWSRRAVSGGLRLHRGGHRHRAHAPEDRAHRPWPTAWVVMLGQDEASRHKLSCFVANIDGLDADTYRFVCNRYDPDAPNALTSGRRRWSSTASWSATRRSSADGRAAVWGRSPASSGSPHGLE